jgi:hypothetical protein
VIEDPAGVYGVLKFGQTWRKLDSDIIVGKVDG